MTSPYTISEDRFDKLFIRLREACLFLIKSDGLALAALATLASLLKLEGPQVLEAAASLIWVFKGLGFLLSASLGTWGLFVMLSASSDGKSNFIGYWVSSILFAALVLAHTGTLAYALGYLVSYLQHLSMR